MRKLHLVTASAIALAAAAPAFAQDGMRYLSWSGKPAVGATPTPPQLQPVANARYPSITSAGGRPSRYSPSVASGSLTPANAWYSTSSALPLPAYATPPAPQPQSYGHPAYAPQPYAPQGFASPPQGGQPVAVPQTAMSAAPVYAQPNYATQPMPAPQSQQQRQPLQQAPTAPVPAWAQPGYTPQLYTPQGPIPAAAQTVQAQPQFQALPQPQPVPVQQAYTPSTVTGPGWASPQPVSAGAPVADPMAPRRDAPIFSIQGAQQQMQAGPQAQAQAQAQGQPQPQAQQTASAEGPARSGPRYYSVHRAAGHEPDPTAMPESVYAVIPEGAFLDAARTDLADPPPPPIQTRTINGRVQAINQGADPSLP